MTLYVLSFDVLAGEEERTWKALRSACSRGHEGLDFISMSTCQTSSDINLTLKAETSEALASFILEGVCPLKGVSDMAIFMLMRPRVFTPFASTASGLKLFTLAIDADPRRYKEVYDALAAIPDSESVVKTFLAYTFQSYEDDLLLNFMAGSVDDAYRFVTEVVRQVPGVSDTKLFYQAQSAFLVPKGRWFALSSEFVDTAAPEGEVPPPAFIVTGL